MTLLEPFTLGNLSLRNRIVVAPMCQYSSVDGMPDDWHLVHLGSRAVGGAGLVFTEAAAVSPEGRITAADAGVWTDAQAAVWAGIVDFVHRPGSAAGIQLAHAGRKASTSVPWQGGGPLTEAQGAWPTVAPSALAFDDGYTVPQVLDDAGLAKVVDDFRAAARRSAEAGFDVIEIHAAHGYLLHQFLSPLSNRRDDRYGGSLENRARLLREVVAAVRAVWPAPKSLWVRVSATDWMADGWSVDDCVTLARWLKADGVDVIDVSSGGNVPRAPIPVAPGYQVPFAARIRHEAGVPVAAVGLITEPAQAQAILDRGEADLIALAREMLRDPYFPRRAAQSLERSIEPPPQYARAW